MFRNLSVFLLILPLCALLSGCAETIYPSVALQMPQGAKVYTAYNIWYENPADIPAVNYHKGKIIPFGTEIEFIGVTKAPLFFPNTGKIVFKVKETNEEFRIEYDQTWMLIPIEDYITRAFSIKNVSELSEGISKTNLERIKRGIVEEGMTRREVLLAFGYPVPHRTPSILDDTWIFWNERLDSVRVVFQKDKVIAILKLD
ncbi:MAG: hypothetical protein A2020_00275 [Lentisphaerae bacterium GWF2_45_14]|nr:MAG: hypothetical protein A2020_00275 [Lentisphaerae bacterium GWF2_45_14]